MKVLPLHRDRRLLRRPSEIYLTLWYRTLLILKPITGHYPEPILFTTHLCFSVFQVDDLLQSSHQIYLCISQLFDVVNDETVTRLKHLKFFLLSGSSVNVFKYTMAEIFAISYMKPRNISPVSCLNMGQFIQFTWSIALEYFIIFSCRQRFGTKRCFECFKFFLLSDAV
jgi:hypothetical protein